MRIAIVTDAWRPQTNGVVRSLEQTASQLRILGHDVLMVTPEGQRTFPLPTYPDIPVTVFPSRRVRESLSGFAPHAIHIATEGPLGLAARAHCRRNNMRFTTSYHTQFPQYIRMRLPLPLSWSYAYLRWFHSPAERILVATQSMDNELRQRGFKRLARWARGVDTDQFVPGDKSYLNARRPVAMYVGRVAVEKNIEAFLALDLAITKFVVGDGPDREPLQRRYPDAHFTGFRYGQELVRLLGAADVFVFPSRTDTFGLVMLEAMACGVPVAAYPVTGPLDVVQDGVTGALDPDLRVAVRRALELDGAAARAYALQRSWRASTKQFLAHLALNAVSAPALRRQRKPG